MNPSSVFKATNNCNYAVEIGKKMGFKLVNIGGSDIYKKNKKLVLAYFWQLVRKHTLMVGYSSYSFIPHP